MFVIAIILGVVALIAVGALVYWTKKDVDLPAIIPGGIAAVTGLAAIVLLFFSATFTQGPGEAKVLKDWTGNVVGESVETGLHFKAPWVDTETFNTRNQTAAFIGNGDHDYNGTKPLGSQITVTDREGVSANMDVVVMYSMKPTSVQEIYGQYRNQETFEGAVVAQAIRSVTRQIPSGFSTMELLNGREKVAVQIKEKLSADLDRRGVIIDSVSLQEVRYSEDVKKRFDDAQASRIAVEKSKADLQRAEIDAKQKVVQAEAESEANRKLAASLTGPILEQRRIDMMRELAKAGNLVVVPEGGGQIVQLPAKK